MQSSNVMIVETNEHIQQKHDINDSMFYTYVGQIGEV